MTPRRRVVFDFFSGAGGSMTGIRRALAELRVDVDAVAVNHWELAVRSHAANHPAVRHVCRDVFDLAPRELAPDGRVWLFNASPECIHHSKARGGAPMDDQSRSTAFIVPHVCSHLDVEFLTVENVPEFVHWGPLDPKTRRPDRARRGDLFRAWLGTIEALGFRCEWRLVNCADFGDATSRVRFMLLGRRDRRAIHWPAPSHSRAPSLLEAPWRAIGPLLELGAEAPSVAWKTRRGRMRSPHTIERIHIGLEKFDGAPFILRRRQHDNPPESDCRSIEAPLHTITANADDIAVIVPRRGRASTLAQIGHRALTVREALRAMSLPDDYVLFGGRPAQFEQIGNAVPAATMAAHVRALVA